MRVPRSTRRFAAEVAAHADGFVDASYLRSEANLGPAGGIARGMEGGSSGRRRRLDRAVRRLDDPPFADDVIEHLVDLAAGAPGTEPGPTATVGGVGVIGSAFDRSSGRMRRLADDELRGSIDVDYIGSNQFPMYRVGAVPHETGVFDPALFWGYDDLDYGLRMRRAGFRLVISGKLARRAHGHFGHLTSDDSVEPSPGGRSRPTARDGGATTQPQPHPHPAQARSASGSRGGGRRSGRSSGRCWARPRRPTGSATTLVLDVRGRETAGPSAWGAAWRRRRRRHEDPPGRHRHRSPRRPGVRPDLGRPARHEHDVHTVALGPGRLDSQLDHQVLGRRRRSPGCIRQLRDLMSLFDVVVAHGSTTLLACTVAGTGVTTPWVYRQIGETLYWAPTAGVGPEWPCASSRPAWWWPWAGADRDVLADRFGVARQRIHVVPTGVPSARFRFADDACRLDARRRFGLQPDAMVVTYVGALSPEKGVETAIEAVAALPGVHLLLAGGGAGRATSSGRPPGGRRHGSHFAGVLDDVEAVHAAADVVVLPSQGGDSMPATIIEAGLCGRATVAAGVGANPRRHRSRRHGRSGAAVGRAAHGAGRSARSSPILPGGPPSEPRRTVAASEVDSTSTWWPVSGRLPSTKLQ